MQAPSHIEPHRPRGKTRVQQSSSHHTLRHNDPIHRRNQQSRPPRIILSTLSLHTAHQELRQAPRHMRPLRLLLRQKHLQVRIPSPQIGHQRTVAEDHSRPYISRQRRPRVRRSRPTHQRTIGIRRISRRQLQHLHPVRILLHAKRAQQVHSGWHGKLCRTKVSSEVSSPNLPTLLQRLHHVIDRRKSSGKILRVRRLAKHHAIPCQKLLRNRVTPLRSRSFLRKRRGIQRPSSLRRRRSRPPRPENHLLIHLPRRLPRTTRS